MSSTFVGPGRSDAKEAQYLGRLLRWTADGITIEGDPKHLSTLKTITNMETCGTVATPVNDSECEKIGTGETLFYELAKKYRGVSSPVLH